MKFLVFSGVCYKRQMQPLNRSSALPFNKKTHSIRLVEIPPMADGIKLSVESSRGLHVSNEPFCSGLRISE